jgi:DNA-binding protein YbaB
MNQGRDPMSSVSDAGAFLDPDASRDYLRTWREDAERKAERAAAMAAQIEQLRASAKDGNDLAEVTVDSAGVLVDLVLTERIHRFEPQVVARAVMSAVRAARAKAAEQGQQIAVDALGPDSLSAQVIGERLRQQLERPDEEADRPGPGEPGLGWGR